MATSPILQLIRRVVEDHRVKQLTDQELLSRFRTERDEAAFHGLLRRHGSMVFDVCRNVLGNEADAEDAFQATFLILAQKAAAIRKQASVGSWLYGVAYRTALKAHANSAMRHKHEAGTPAPTLSGASDDLNWREVRQVVHAEVNRLSECYRAPLVLCYLEGKKQDEAALLLGVSKATVKKRLEGGILPVLPVPVLRTVPDRLPDNPRSDPSEAASAVDRRTRLGGQPRLMIRCR
jgi:RNA polymerase sigma factor (sigma-70 family)